MFTLSNQTKKLLGLTVSSIILASFLSIEAAMALGRQLPPSRRKPRQEKTEFTNSSSKVNNSSLDLL